MHHFLLVTVSFFLLLTIASFASAFARKIKIPYTIVLFIVGILLVTVGSYFPHLTLISEIKLSKDLVFFIFLPTLIFESGYNLPYKKILRDAVPILSLSVFSLLISTVLIGILFKFFLGLFGFMIPYSVSLLFGAIISATDPVAVLAIFKEYGVPKRVMYLFEGESLFNDGTAVALFLIIMGVIESGMGFTTGALWHGTLTFLSMILGGIGFGLLMGYVFSKMIEWVKDPWAELTLTLIMAHTTFILAEICSEHFETFKISAIIATTLAAMTLGNYGRYKISGSVRKMMHTTWGYFAFISNSLIFLLMGMLIGNINFHIQILIIPILIGVFVVIFSRIVSVMGVLTPLNFFLKTPINYGWQKLIAWGSLRGAIAITMLLLIPPHFSVPGWNCDIAVQEFLAVIVIVCVVFTLLIKTTTIKKIIEKMGLADLSREEEFTLHQIKELIDKSILMKLLTSQNKEYIPDEVVSDLIEKYKGEDEKEKREIERCCLEKGEFRNLLKRYALGIERHTVLELFEARETNEQTLKAILNKIENQYMRLEEGKSQIKEEHEKECFAFEFQQRLLCRLNNGKHPASTLKKQYLFYRSRAVVTEMVLKQLSKFRDKFYQDPMFDECFDEIICQYQRWRQTAIERIDVLTKKIETKTRKAEKKLFNNQLVYFEEKLVDKLYAKHIMNGKLHNMLKKSIWE